MREDEATAQLAALQKASSVAEARRIEPWRAAFARAAELRASSSEVNKALSDAMTQVNTAAATVREKLQAALSTSEVRQAVRSQTVSSEKLEPGRTKTPSPVNYASVDLGVLAAPWPGDDVGTWLVSYVGVNLYLVPVERKIAVRDLVGPKVWQRVSVTVGWAISAPSSSNRTLSGPMGGKYPLLGIGWRTGQFTRVLGGALFYEAASANPASREKSLYAAGFFGASLDFDVVKFVSDQIK